MNVMQRVRQRRSPLGLIVCGPALRLLSDEVKICEAVVMIITKIVLVVITVIIIMVMVMMLVVMMLTIIMVKKSFPFFFETLLIRIFTTVNLYPVREGM